MWDCKFIMDLHILRDFDHNMLGHSSVLSSLDRNIPASFC